MTTETKRVALDDMQGRPYVLVMHEEDDYYEDDPRTIESRIGEDKVRMVMAAAKAMIANLTANGQAALDGFGGAKVAFLVDTVDGHRLEIRFEWPGIEPLL